MRENNVAGLTDKKKTKEISKNFFSGIRGIIFDCDGVMIDSAEANRHLYNLILRAFDLPDITREQELFAFQATFAQAIQKLVPQKFHDKLEDTIAKVINYDKDILPKIKLMPGYEDFINKAHERGLLLAIDTNRTEAGILKVIDKFQLPKVFDPIISSSVAAPKPSPEGAEMIKNAWKLPQNEILFIGDSPDDCKAAEGAGLPFIGFGDNLSCGLGSISSWKEMARILWK